MLFQAAQIAPKLPATTKLLFVAVCSASRESMLFRGVASTQGCPPCELDAAWGRG